MNELIEIYKRIEYLRNNGVKMKDIADRIDMAPSVLSALYSSVLPTYMELLHTHTSEEALDEALALVNNVSKKRLLGNLNSTKLLLMETGTSGRRFRKPIAETIGRTDERICTGSIQLQWHLLELQLVILYRQSENRAVYYLCLRQ